MKISIKTKFVSLIVVSVLGVSLIVVLASFFGIRDVFESRVYAQLESVSVLKKNQIENFILEASREVEYLTKQDVLIDLVLDKSLIKDGNYVIDKATEKQIDNFLGHSEKFLGLSVVDLEGEVFFSSDKSDIGKIKDSEDYFLKGKSEVFVQELLFDISEKVVTIMIGAPIKDSQGNLLGVLAVKVDVDEINDLLLERSGLGSTGETFIVNANNMVSTSLLKDPDAAFRKTLYLPQIAECLAGNSFNREVVDYVGEDVFGKFTWFPEIHGCMVTKVDVLEAFASIERTYIAIMTVGVVVGVLAGLIGHFLVVRMLRPLEILRSEVEKIEKGDFEVEVDVRSSDELGEVARAFKNMAARLKLLYEGLQEKVDSKTKDLEEKVNELEKMNKLMVGRELTMIDLKKQIKKNKENEE